MNKSEQLIACLEGEIAKRDEELAACRVAVENCDMFRAQIAELDEKTRTAMGVGSGSGNIFVYGNYDSIKAAQKIVIERDQLRAELAAIKAQEPVAVVHAQHGFCWYEGRKPAPGTNLYASPVSEAKAQGAVMLPSVTEVMNIVFDYQHNKNKNVTGTTNWAANIGMAVIDEIAHLNAAPVQQVSVPDGLELIKRMQVCLSLDDTEWGLSAPEKYKLLGDIKSYVLAAPAAPAADAGLVLEQAMYALIGIGYHENSGLVHELRQSLAAHRAKGVV